MINEENKMKYGYARCSTTKQDALYEIEALLNMGIPREHIYVEYVSGSKTRNQRPEFDKLMTILENNPGSVLAATDFYRVSRNIQDMVALIEIVKKYKLKLEIGQFKFDCRNEKLSFIDEFIIMLFGILGDLDNKAKRQNTIYGMETARRAGKQIGRPIVTKKDLENNAKFLKYYLQWKNKEITLCEMQKLYGVKSRTTCYNHIKTFEQK